MGFSRYRHSLRAVLSAVVVLALWLIPVVVFAQDEVEQGEQVEQNSEAQAQPAGEESGVIDAAAEGMAVDLALEEKRAEDPGPYPINPPKDPKIPFPPYWKKRKLADKDIKRYLKGLELQKKRQYQHWKYIQDRWPDSPRGAPEAVVCSLNLNNIGSPGQYRKIMRAKSLKKLSRKRASMVEGIERVNCDVVAVQGIVGTSYGKARKGLEYFAKPLRERTKKKWRALIGESNHKSSYNGFLVREGIHVIGVKSYVARELPVSGNFKLELFPRGPFELRVQIPGKEGTRDRTLVIINSLMQQALRPFPNERVEYKVQMAEVLRRVTGARAVDAAKKERPIVVLAVDRAAPRKSLAARVIEGKVRMRDFTRGKRCELVKKKYVNGKEVIEGEEEEEDEEDEEDEEEEEVKAVVEWLWVADCKRPPKYVKKLFGIFGEHPHRRKELVQKQTEEKMIWVYDEVDAIRWNYELWHQRKLTAEMYMTSKDIKLVRERDFETGRLKIGMERVDNGLPYSPLLWAEFNW